MRMLRPVLMAAVVAGVLPWSPLPRALGISPAPEISMPMSLEDIDCASGLARNVNALLTGDGRGGGYETPDAAVAATLAIVGVDENLTVDPATDSPETYVLRRGTDHVVTGLASVKKLEDGTYYADSVMSCALEVAS